VREFLGLGILALFSLQTVGCSKEDNIQNGSDSLAAIHALPQAAQDVFEEIRASGLYKKPTYQDCVTQLTHEPSTPYILSPRRQTDGLVRQLFELLPLDIKEQVAFVIPDRMVQSPETYANYVANRKQVYLLGNIPGTSSVAQCILDNKKTLGLTYKFMRAAGFDTSAIHVIYTKGDSPSDIGGTNIRARQAESLRNALSRVENKLCEDKISCREPPEVKVSWGADELVLLAFAATLPTKRVAVTISNAEAPMRWEADTPIASIVSEKLRDAGLEETTGNLPADFKLVIHSGQQDSRWDPFPNDPNVAYVDRRYSANGGYDYKWAPLKRCDNLAYGAWGTAANAVGSAIATAKILLHKRDEDSRKRLFLEAVAHDAIFIGAASRDTLSRLIPGYEYSSARYYSRGFMDYGLKLASGYVQKTMEEIYRGSSCMTGKQVTLKTLLPRFFEADIRVD
jgi:hypothetical protein